MGWECLVLINGIIGKGTLISSLRKLMLATV